MKTIAQLERLIGIMKNNHFLSPRLMDVKEFGFPKASSLFWTDWNNFPRKSHPYFYNQDSPRMYILSSYIKAPFGKYKKINMPVTRLISERRPLEPNFEYSTKLDKMLKTPIGRLCVFDFSEIDKIYRYTKNKEEAFNRQKNRWVNILSSSNSGVLTNRNIFLDFEIPKVIPTYTEVIKLMKYSGYRLFQKLEDPSQYILIELLKLLHEDYTKDSIFNEVKDIDTNNMMLLFHYEGKVTFSRLYNIMAIAECTGKVSARLKSYSSIKAIKTILFYITMIKVSEVSDVNQLEMGKDIVSKNLSNTDVNIDNVDIDTIIKNTNDRNANTDPIEVSEDVIEEDVVIKEEKDIAEKNEEALKAKVADGKIKEKKAEEIRSISLKNKEIIKTTETTEEEKKVQDKKIPEDLNVIDKSMLEIPNFSKPYIEKVYQKQQNKVLYSLESAGFAIKSHEIKREQTLANDTTIHTIEILQPSGTTIKQQIRIPTLLKDGKMRFNGKIYTMSKQKLDAPIKKIRSTEVALTSYYGKLFIKKAQYSKDNAAVFINRKLLKMATTPDSTIKIALVVSGKTDIVDVDLPLSYTMIGRETRSFKLLGKTSIYFLFDYYSREQLVNKGDDLKKIEKLGVLTGVDTKSYYVINHKNELLHVDKSGLNIDTLGSIFSLVGINESEMPIEHATVKIVGTTLTLLIPMIYYFGLSPLLKLLKAKNRFETTRPTLSNHEYVVRFEDGYLILDRRDKEASIILGGFTAISKFTKLVPMKTLNNKSGIMDLLHSLGCNIRTISELSTLKNMFIDPMTEDVLKYMKEPATLEGLFIRSAELLSDDNYKDPNHVSTYTIKGFERINGMVYHALAMGVREYETKLGNVRAKFNVHPYVIFNYLSKDATFTLEDDLNPIASLKQEENITMSGMFGRQQDSITNKHRTFSPSEVGIISGDTKDSDKVGVVVYQSALPKVDNIYGFGKEHDIKDLTPTNIYSPSVLLAPGALLDDGKRALFNSIQIQHVVPTTAQSVLPLRTGYEQVVPYRVDKKFAIHAEKPGKVIKLTKSSITVQYTDGDRDTFKFKEWMTKEIGGVSYTHRMSTPLFKEDTFKDGDNILYDEAFFGIDMFNRKRVCYKSGVLANVIFTESQEVYEDSCSVSLDFSTKLETPITYVKSPILETTSTLKSILKVGDTTEYHDPLLVFSREDNSNIPMDIEVYDKNISILEELNDTAPKAKVRGKVIRIEAVYNAEPDNISDSIKELISKTDPIMKETYGYIGRVDNTYSIKGKPLRENEIEIKFFIEKNLKAGLADKLVIANQLKATIGKLFDTIVTESGRVIDLEFGKKSVDARIVVSPLIEGTTNLLLEEGTNLIIEAYDS